MVCTTSASKARFHVLSDGPVLQLQVMKPCSTNLRKYWLDLAYSHGLLAPDTLERFAMAWR